MNVRHINQSQDDKRHRALTQQMPMHLSVDVTMQGNANRFPRQYEGKGQPKAGNERSAADRKYRIYF